MPATVKPAVNIITRDGLPALNVKVSSLPHWPDAATVAKGYGVTEEVARRLLETLWNIAVEDFWVDAEAAVRNVFKLPTTVKVYSEGRSGGWLVVHGLGDVAAWTRAERQRWARFTADIQAAIDYRSSQEWATETLTQILEDMRDTAAADRVRDAAPQLLRDLKRAVYELSLARPGKGQDSADIAGALELARAAIALATNGGAA